MIIGVNATKFTITIAEITKSLAALLLMPLALVSIAAAAEAPRSAPAEGSPAAWLWAADKSDAWKAATLRSRELLSRLNLQEPSSQKHLPKVKAKTQLLLRSPGFDWKSKTAVDYLENMLEDLIVGRDPHTRYAGKEFGYAYWSEAMERIEAIWVHVPPEYDPAKTYQFFMYYKCGGGIHLKNGLAAGGYRPTLDVANRTDSFHAWSSLNTQVKGRMGAHIELQEATAALVQDFSVDPDRIFLTGWSDGGFTAVWVASRYPHLVAGIAPNCANWQYSNIEDIGLWGVPMLAVDGWSDGGYNNLQFCRWLTLQSLGADASGIWGQHGHSYQPYEDVEEFRYIMDWAKGRKRDLYPKQVRYATWNLNWNRAYWFSIERVVSPVLAAQFEAEVLPGNLIRVQSRNVAAYKLALNDKLVDPQKPITVTTDGHQSYSGPFRAELLIESAPRPAGKFVKDASLPDEITAAMVESSYDTQGLLAIPSRKWMAIRPTGWNEKTAGLLAKWAPTNAKADTAVDDHDLSGNLLIYGGPDINKLSARIASDLPVKFASGKFRLGGKTYDRPTECIAFLHPNPFNPKKYVLIYAFNDADAFARQNFFGFTGGSLSEFRAGDCIISGIPTEPRRWGVALDNKPFRSLHLMFDGAWQADQSPPLGELERPLDYLQFLRLKADAIREATGANIGVIWEHTPYWNRWGTGLPAGPVTLHDLATLDMFPENITVAEMTGTELRRRNGRPAAWSVVADKREPAFDGKSILAATELDPGKTYRVAMGSYGRPYYGATPSRMGRLFAFATPEEFLSSPANSIPLRNVKPLPLQVIEATAQFIQKRKTVSPRPVCFDLTEYIINPKDNSFGACDWLHLGLDNPWRSGSNRANDRFTLNLGLRQADEPDAAPPRSNTQHFLELGPNFSGTTTFGFSGLEKKLPVKVSVGSDHYAITTDKERKTFALADAGTIENKVGQCLLIRVQLVNDGPKEIAATAVLSAPEMRQVSGQSWPDEGGKTQPTYYAGYHRTVGGNNQPPVHEDAALFLFADTRPNATKLVAPSAGYNFGLVGFSTPLSVKAGQTISFPLLFVAVDKPSDGAGPRLADVLEGLKAELNGRAQAERP
jgi:pimeloyl-ACP methyl ester carboxylesterase